MRKLVSGLILGAATSLACLGPAHAAGPTSHPAKVDWGKRDTAVYVVSTLNLIHSKRGQSAASVFANQAHVVRYDVYSDQKDANLYFVQLVRADGSTAGAFAYSMGWKRPQVVSSLSVRVAARQAPSSVVSEFKSDPKELIGSFTSTLPQ